MKNKLINKYNLFCELASYYWARFLRFFSYLRYRYKKNSSSLIDAKGVVLFDTEGLLINRRLAQVVLQFAKNRYDCKLKISAKDFAYTSKDDYSDVVFSNTSLIQSEPYDIVICSKSNKRYNNKKKIIFDDSISEFPNRTESLFFYPLYFHVNQISANSEQYIDSITTYFEQRIGAVFIGNTDKKTYSNNDYIHSCFSMHTRLETLEYIKKTFPDAVYEPENIDDFNTLFLDNNLPLKNKIVIIDKFFIHGKDYFKVLSSSAFHIWTCGDWFPYCHNQFEGMACGAIPICEEYKNKPLYGGMENNKNCLCYRDLSELESIIKMVTNINYSEAFSIRYAVRNLFVSRFSLSAFDTKIKEFLSTDKVNETYYIHPSIYKK